MTFPFLQVTNPYENQLSNVLGMRLQLAASFATAVIRDDPARIMEADDSSTLAEECVQFADNLLTANADIYLTGSEEAEEAYEAEMQAAADAKFADEGASGAVRDV